MNSPPVASPIAASCSVLSGSSSGGSLPLARGEGARSSACVLGVGPGTIIATVIEVGLMTVLGTALGYWAMTMVNRSLPAMTTSLGLLATPVVGTAGASLMLGEPITLSLISAMVLIIGGIAIGTLIEGTSR